MKKQLKNNIMLSSLCAFLIMLISCSTSTQQRGTVYNPDTKEVEHHNYGPFYQLKAEIIPQNLKFTLLTQLQNKTFPGAYTIKEYTRRLLPNDYMAKSNTSIYLNNISDMTIHLELISISLENKQLPLSKRSLKIPAHETITIPLGETTIDLRLTTLNARIEYMSSGPGLKSEHKEKEFDLLRDIIIKKDKDVDKKE